MTNQIPTHNGGNGVTSTKNIPAQHLIADGASSWAIVKDPRKLFFKSVGALGIVLVVLYGIGFFCEVLFPGNGVTRVVNSVPSRVTSGAASSVRSITNDAGASFQTVTNSGGSSDAAVVLPENRQSQVDSSFQTQSSQ